MRTVAAAIVLALVALAIFSVARAAPTIKDRPDPAPNHVTGPLAIRMSSPVIVLPGESGDGETPETIVWLVFTRPEQEAECLKGRAEGDRITARGRLGWGGAYRYLVVATIEAE